MAYFLALNDWQVQHNLRRITASVATITTTTTTRSLPEIVTVLRPLTSLPLSANLINSLMTACPDKLLGGDGGGGGTDVIQSYS